MIDDDEANDRAPRSRKQARLELILDFVVLALVYLRIVRLPKD